MLVALITHPVTRLVAKGHCRALDPTTGRGEALAAAVRLKELLSPLLKSRGIDHIGALITSPATRCVETLIIVGDALTDVVAVDQITLEPELAEQKDANGDALPLSTVRLNSVLSNHQRLAAAIVSLHGDAASALPSHWFAPGDVDDKGFFTSKPVLIVMDVNPMQGIASGAILAYESFGKRPASALGGTTKP